MDSSERISIELENESIDFEVKKAIIEIMYSKDIDPYIERDMNTPFIVLEVKKDLKALSDFVKK